MEYSRSLVWDSVQGRAQTINGAISVGQELDSEQFVTIKGFNDYLRLDNNLYIYRPIKNKKVKEVVEKPRNKVDAYNWN